MKFIDEAKIYVKAGDGGHGCVSFRREKYVPHGGPDGGNGGKGGDVIFRADINHRTLLDLKYRQHHVAKNGGHGQGNNKTGKSALDVEIHVPIGTLIYDADTGEMIVDLVADGQSCTIVKGGIGGKGNAFFTSSTHQTPRFAQDGIKGEERWIRLELKLLADVGIIGLPNVGKSTFISKVSAAKPKIADYPFTTLVPNLGVVKYGDLESFVIADIPGLIEGAHEGMGMGTRFLRHIERTNVLLHILDISLEDSDAWRDYQTVNRELFRFNKDLAEKIQIVAINKIDLPMTQQALKKAIDIFQKNGLKVFAFSAVTGEGVSDIIWEIVKNLNAQQAD